MKINFYKKKQQLEHHWRASAEEQTFDPKIDFQRNLRKFQFIPSLYIFCQPGDLEISSLDEQWEVCVYEDNSILLPARMKMIISITLIDAGHDS